MVNDDDSTKRNEEAPGEPEDLFDTLESSSGMSMARMLEIEEAESSGHPLELSSDELKQYEESKNEVAKIGASLRVTMNEIYEPINKQLKGIIAQSFHPMQHQPLQPPAALVPHVPDYSSMYTEIAEAANERAEREESNASNIAQTAIAMQNLLGQVQADSEKTTVQWRWMMAIATLTLLAAAIAAGPPIIDWLNG